MTPQEYGKWKEIYQGNTSRIKESVTIKNG